MTDRGIDLGGYVRRLDVDDYRVIRRDVPRDIGELLRIVLDLEREEYVYCIDTFEPSR